jgi:iron(III) transport system permease protein
LSLITGVVLAFPVLLVVASIFQAGSDTWSHLLQTGLGRYAWNTALLLLAVGWGVISMGVLSAWLITEYRFPGRDLLQWALMLPLAMPAYVMAYAYTDWLQFTGPVQSALRSVTGWEARDYWFPEIRSLTGAAAMLSFALYPYVYLIARTAFIELPRSAIEAGRLAGYGAWGAFFRVAVPLARPAIAAGASLALMETLADFGTVSYFAVEVFTTGIFKAWLSLGDAVAAAQLSACLLGFVVLVLALERSNRGRAAYYGIAPRKPPPPQRLRGWAATAAALACGAPVLFGFGLPAALLAYLAWGEASAATATRTLALVGNSFSLAGLTSLIAVLLALVMAYAARSTGRRVVSLVNRWIGLGYAVPGAVIAIGVLVPLARLDNFLADALERLLDVKLGLLLTGTVVALVYAYLVRLLAVALQTTEAGLAKITPSMEDASRSLGATPVSTLLRVHAPLLAPTLATAALLVFVDVLKELPATFALRPFNFDTLAIEAYNLAKDERLAEAGIPSLVIVAAGLLPVILVSRRLLRAGAA